MKTKTTWAPFPPGKLCSFCNGVSTDWTLCRDKSKAFVNALFVKDVIAREWFHLCIAFEFGQADCAFGLLKSNASFSFFRA